LWRSQGYGYILAIDSTEFSWYQVTTVSLIPEVAGTVAGDSLLVGDIPFGTMSKSGDNLILTVDRFTVIKFDRIATLPDITQPTTDPEFNFEVFWHSFEEYCALFTLTNVDWQATYNQYRPRVTAATTEAELFGIFAEMVTPLNDRHTRINAVIDGQEVSFSPGHIPASQWISERVLDFLQVGIANYLDAGTFRTAANDKLFYGTIHQSIGYLNIASFDGFSETPENEELEEAIFTENLDMILTEFQNMDALIIDIRWNDGGSGPPALALGRRLTDQERLAFSTQVRIGGYDQFSEPTPYYVAPAGVQFLNKPIILLTSGLSISAADRVAMALKPFTNVTQIGETTYGALSLVFLRDLPNGWSFTTSMERILSAEGIDYEQKGIAPEIEVIANEDSLNADIDNILSLALRELMRTGVSSSGGAVPAIFALAQNYPNPFNPETVISYQLPVVSEVRLTIFNALGQEIRTLVKGRQSPGLKLVVWDGKNDLGQAVNSGIYFYTLKAGERVQTKKMLLMR
jgi:hypothetical protein